MHDQIADLKRVSTQLGKVPTRDEYLEHGKYPKSQIDKLFGNFSAFIQASGLRNSYKEKDSIKKRVQDFYHRDLSAHLKTKKPGPDMNLLGPFEEIACIGDMHCPWVCNDSLSLVYALLDYLKPKHVIQMGDCYDFYSFTKFPRSHLQFDPATEVETARKQMETFWKTVRKLLPKAELIQIKGNHDVRPHKRILETSAPELEVFFDFNSLFHFDGVHTVDDAREPHRIGDISFIHGFSSRPGSHRIKLNSHVVHGHTHKGGLNVDKINGQWFFELDCGFVGDPSAKCFNYTPVKELRWTRGMGYISRLGPNFLPFE